MTAKRSRKKSLKEKLQEKSLRQIHVILADAHARGEDLIKLWQQNAPDSYERTIDTFATSAMVALIGRMPERDLKDIVSQRELVATAFHFAKFAVAEKGEMFRQENEDAEREAEENP